MRRSASRLTRLLACAAVPVMLVVAGCSSGSDDKSEADTSSAPAPKASATVEPAKYSGLPDSCDTISRATVDSLVPKAKIKGGSAGKSSDISTRSSCSWNGLDDNGVKGSQYRWLDVSLMRYDSDVTLGSGAKRAGAQFTKEVAAATSTEGAKSLKATPSTDVGDQATVVTYTLKKTGEDFAYVTVVARTENVVVTLTYNGAGYAGAKSPSSADLTKDAVSAAQGVVTEVATGSGDSPDAPASGSASKKASPSASAKS
ncbi:DUF3558 domain-containing protein [Streptomyces sp. SID3212]|uniref:DUF3558 domain-containing protein n=1 Tax=Streptomyces sp. SID3212 TaxID=2690259 RepID=UPI00136DDD65|nr:DUF3558 domain-containing protein [Streptomyces sp. SID3212]MYV55307.1 DUF3558 domain-containing protein [Streptomyces sp. SID3212]